MMDTALNDLLADFPMIVTLPVQWGDQDAFGHVNNTVYLRWFESGRVDYFEKIGLSESMRRMRVGPILASITCHYRKQVNFPDQIRIGTRVHKIGRSSMVLDHRIVSESSRAVVAEGISTVVVFDYAKNQSVPVPDEIRQAINQLEGKEF